MSGWHSLSFLAVLFLTGSCVAAAQGPSQDSRTPKTSKLKAEEPDAEIAQRRVIAISLVTALADEARSFNDQTRRARVQARAADVLWDTDPDKARELFRRAWDAAVIVDAETEKTEADEMRRLRASGGPTVMNGRPDLRSEVLRLVAKRDRKLGEQFLKALDEATEKEREEKSADARMNGPGRQIGAAKRLQLARRLIEDGQVERAIEFASPALIQVSVDAIFFLSALRENNPQMADSAFAGLIARVARDPLTDANTVSGLSSYLFTPFLYVTFEPDGGGNQNRARPPTPGPDVAPQLRTNFLQFAFQVLMAPLPAPDQDHTTSGRAGKYLVIKRLLPLFEQYSADLAAPLRTQMTALAADVPPQLQQGENRAVANGIVPEEVQSDPYQRMQDRLDRAARSEDRDAIYADYAVSLTEKRDPRARELVDKIENSELRKNVKAYVDFQLTQAAVRNKDVAEIVRLAKTGELTSIQKVWAYSRAAKLMVDSDRSGAADLLEQGLVESRRISSGEPDRARALTAIAAGLVNVDQVRAWETLSEVVKAANSADVFTGEDSRISASLKTDQMVVVTNASADEFDLLSAFRPLAHADLMRAIQLAKNFTGEAARAVATLAIARSVLEKNRDTLVAGAN
ncbi:MAG: hypothetical protein ABR555_18575 [Pyrinomonadaceae bacterium]